MRIMYVEDNLANVSLLRRIAGKHEVINYIDGEEALRNFPNDKPDLILMDVQLAGQIDGLEVVRRLRAEGHTLPIVAVTAYAMIGDRERCLSAGCDDYIAKPLSIPRLVEMLNHYTTELAEKGTLIRKITQITPQIDPLDEDTAPFGNAPVDEKAKPADVHPSYTAETQESAAHETKEMDHGTESGG